MNPADASYFQWAVGIVLGAFSLIFGSWNLHIQKRVDDLQEKSTQAAQTGDDKLWQAMEARHAQNLMAIEAMRNEQARGILALTADIQQLRENISSDRRQEIAELRAEIRNLKGD